jgi:hypothetical protein
VEIDTEIKWDETWEIVPGNFMLGKSCYQNMSEVPSLSATSVRQLNNKNFYKTLTTMPSVQTKFEKYVGITCLAFSGVLMVFQVT